MTFLIPILLAAWFGGILLIGKRYDPYGPNPWYLNALRWTYGLVAASPVILLAGLVVYWIAR